MRAITGKDAEQYRGEVYNVGGGHGNTVSLLELCRRWDITPQFGDWRPADQKVFYCNISKAEKDFGWKPKVGLDQGLTELYAWTEKSLGLA
jgi:CDP-paratose 2-epimerase